MQSQKPWTPSSEVKPFTLVEVFQFKFTYKNNNNNMKEQQKKQPY